MIERIRIGAVIAAIDRSQPHERVTVAMCTHDYNESLRDMWQAGADVLGEPITLVNNGAVVTFIADESAEAGTARLTFDDSRVEVIR